MSKSTVRQVAETIATAFGMALQTSYELRDGSWRVSRDSVHT